MKKKEEKVVKTKVNKEDLSYKKNFKQKVEDQIEQTKRTSCASVSMNQAIFTSRETLAQKGALSVNLA